ncbi:type II secretion system F family protein [Tessaracoccus oleiagri]|uniref:Tight adherence protein C n=1 Tax=Tessaracoccus oleiagri TaxID=686624 RepID=A0A1G9MGZ2_9ACTN|nr:type II secretion system F family protein [Tessaracoccus oleiagri]SDL73536.1 tight adherence protein C [Tessaracoccus oleiagri]
MNEIILAASLLAALAVGTVVWTVATIVDPQRKQLLANLQRGPVARGATAEPVHGPRPNPLPALARRLTPPVIVKMLERQYLLAGRPMAWPIEKLLVLKMVWIPVGILFGYTMINASEAPLMKLIFVIVPIVVYFLPELLLNSHGQKRNETIELELADTLDQMMISVEAGLGFDAAMSMAAKNGKGPLAEELKRTFQDIQIGRSRRQAFEALTHRTTVADLRRFVRAVIQADAYGISISDVLRTQASEMRLKRRQRAEEKAQKIPVKVLMPLMLFILPVLFIVVLGPAVMGMVEAFGGM